ncbi:putative C2H2 finger domain protein [Aspergillus ruber CBS 135680]|uniref:C2H2-type domain-containing protein n=1 Tax=Aspergillus ruber (strain CBS 135680) TaxID=1388766 RepID=A0A017S239_ASPRC|nr:uncharacterized protein EURHEDRAFT_416909 [Aspergillus ruber CBS 135680]EYE91002.1 hypothetical protein EURHEDRAFT_416909 [Aspergillus ruber CBS 135680]
MPAEDYEWIANYWPQPSFSLGATNGYPDVQTRHVGQNSTPGYDGHMDRDPIALAQSALKSSVTYQPQNVYSYMSPHGSFFPPALMPAQPHQQHYQPALQQQHPPQCPQSAAPVGFRGHHPSTMSSQAPNLATSHPPPHTQPIFARPAPDLAPGPAPSAQQRPPAVSARRLPAPKPRAPLASSLNDDAKRRRVESGGQAKGISKHKLSGYSYQPSHPTRGTVLRDRNDIIRPLNKKDAAEKMAYDPKTVARDILVASGRHPTEPALNHHLSRLRDIFNLVDNTADLATIRWDIVDTPNMQVPHMHADPEPVSKHIPPPPVPIQSPAVNGWPPAQQACPASHSAALPRTPPAAPPRDQQQPITASPRPTPPSFPPAVSDSVPQPQQQKKQEQPQKKRKKKKKQPEPKQPQGRPQSPASVPKQSPVPLVQVRPPKSSPRPQKLKAISLPRLPSSPARSNKSTPSQSARRGRTPNKPKQPETMVGKKSAPKVEVSIPLSAPPVSYPVYACEWQNCQSELHNLELLRHHLLKSHIPYTITCSWSGCDCNDPMAAAELFNHVKSNHLDPLAWKLGDGPSVPQTGETDIML